MARQSTILLADDNPDDVKLTCLCLKEFGVEDSVRIVKNGEEAISYLKGEGTFADRQRFPYPKLLLLDMRMPRKNGLEVLQWMNDNRHESPVVVVLATGGEIKETAQAYKLGAFSFLQKPADRAEVRNLFKALVEDCRMDATERAD